MNPKLLIVDDDDQLTVTLKELLEASYFVKVASSGRQAIEELKNWKPDLILLDQNMPEMDGITTLQLIKSDQEMLNIPIIMLTGMDSSKERKNAYLLGIDDFISKPFEFDELLIRINAKLIKSNAEFLKTKTIIPKNSSILVADPLAANRNLLKSGLMGMGIEVKTTKSIAESLNLIQTNKPDLLFLSSDLIDLLSQKESAGIKTILLTSNESNNFISQLKEHPEVSSIIELKQNDRSFNLKSIITTASKILSGDFFGIEKYLNWGVELYQFTTTGSKNRFETIQQLNTKLEDLGIKSIVRTSCLTVAEEMLMNAIYDAPRDDSGKAIHNHKSRNEEVILEPSQYPTLKIGTDGIFLAVSVEDPFGCFPKETILKYLENNYQNNHTEIHQINDKGGAGKGIYMITENSDLVVYNVKNKIKTEVIAIFDLDPNKSKKMTSIHYFEQ